MAERYPKRKLSTEEISRALNFESDSDDSNDKLENLLGGSAQKFEIRGGLLYAAKGFCVRRR